MKNPIAKFFSPRSEIDNKLHILSFLLPSERLQIRLVHPEWKSLAEIDEDYWQKAIKADFGQAVCQHIEPSPGAYVTFYMAHLPGYLDYLYSDENYRHQFNEVGIKADSRSLLFEEALKHCDYKDKKLKWFYEKFAALPGFEAQDEDYKESNNKAKAILPYLLLAQLFPYALNAIFNELQNKFTIEKLIAEYEFAIPALITLFPNQRDLFYTELTMRLAKYDYVDMLDAIEALQQTINLFYANKSELLTIILQAKLPDNTEVDKTDILTKLIKFINLFPNAAVELAIQFAALMQNVAIEENQTPFNTLTQNLPKHLSRYACLQAKSKNYELAAAYLNAAIALRPSWPFLYYQRSLINYLWGKSDDVYSDSLLTIEETQEQYLEQLQNRVCAFLPLQTKAKYKTALADYLNAARLSTLSSSEYAMDFAKALAPYQAEQENKQLEIIIEQPLITQANKIRFISEDDQYYDWRGLGYMNQKQYDKANLDYAEAIRLEPKKADYYFQRSHILLHLEFYEAAIHNIDTFLTLVPPDHPDVTEAYQARYTAYSKLGRNNEALRDLVQSIPKNADTYSKLFCALGDTLYEREQYMGAIQAYQQAIEFELHLLHAYEGLIVCHYDTGEYPQAISFCNKYLALKPDDVDIIVMRGKIKHAAGQLPEALEDYQLAIALNSSDIHAYIHLAFYYLELGHLLEAQAMIAQAAALEPGNINIQANLAFLHLLQGQYQSSRELFQKLLTQSNTDVCPSTANNTHYPLALLDWLEGNLPDFPEQVIEHTWQSENNNGGKINFCQNIVLLLTYITPEAVPTWHQAYAFATTLIERTRAIRAVGYLNRLQQRLHALFPLEQSLAQLASQRGIFRLNQTTLAVTPEALNNTKQNHTLW